MPAGVLVGVGGRVRQEPGQLGVAAAGGHVQVVPLFRCPRIMRRFHLYHASRVVRAFSPGHLFPAFQIMSETLMKRSANAAQSCRKREGRAA